MRSETASDRCPCQQRHPARVPRLLGGCRGGSLHVQPVPTALLLPLSPPLLQMELRQQASALATVEQRLQGERGCLAALPAGRLPSRGLLRVAALGPTVPLPAHPAADAEARLMEQERGQTSSAMGLADLKSDLRGSEVARQDLQASDRGGRRSFCQLGCCLRAPTLCPVHHATHSRLPSRSPPTPAARPGRRAPGGVDAGRHRGAP